MPASQGDCQCLAINIFKRDKSNRSVSEGPVHSAPEAEKWSQEGGVHKSNPTASMFPRKLRER